MKYILAFIFLFGICFSQEIINEISYPLMEYSTLIDTTVISEEEQYLKDISDEALAKDEKRKVITNRILLVIIAVLLVDKFVK